MRAHEPGRIGAAFEGAPALVARLVGPFGSTDAVIEAARVAVADMSEEERVDVLASHPAIGEDVRSLSEASRREQGEDRDPEVLAELARLNGEYERRHGFRFVVFVAGRSKREILAILRERLERPSDKELATGLDELLAIARDRLERAR